MCGCAHLNYPNAKKDTSTQSNSKFEFARSAMQGYLMYMEDTDICYMNTETQDFLLFGVFDGHGGREVAQFVKFHFLDELQKNDNFKAKAFEIALQETFMKMDELLQSVEGKKEISRLHDPDAAANEVESLFDAQQSGCAAIIVLIHENTMYVANAGNCRCVVGRNGQALEMSIDHMPENQNENKRILAAGGCVVDGYINNYINISRAIGDLEYKQNGELPPDKQLVIAFPDVKVSKIETEFDFVLIGCDGVWDRNTNQENVAFVSEAIKKGVPLAKIVEDLLDELLKPVIEHEPHGPKAGKGLDNMTMIIVKFIK